MNTLAVVLEQPERIALKELDLVPPGVGDVTVNIEWSGISTGTERLLWSGKMPSFPGMGYPLVPGYESVGRVTEVHQSDSKLSIGDQVFVPGANCYGEVRGLFGGAAAQVVVSQDRVVPISSELAEEGVLLALAATAYHASLGQKDKQPDLIIGHGVLGRLLARIAVLLGDEPPVVWEKNPARQSGADGYYVIDPANDDRKDYRNIYDVSGDASLINTLIQVLAKGGEIVLAGFYAQPVSFLFPPAFMREARFRIAAEWQPADLIAVNKLVASGELSLDGLITHRSDATHAEDAYRTAFADPDCLKMILDWRTC